MLTRERRLRWTTFSTGHKAVTRSTVLHGRSQPAPAAAVAHSITTPILPTPQVMAMVASTRPQLPTPLPAVRSADRRVGKERVSTGRSWGGTYTSQTKYT